MLIPFLYSCSVRAYSAALQLASPFVQKAALWTAGRKKQAYPASFEKKGKTVWFHCASLGEFEQARPLIELYKREEPAVQIILTFFSPSGYEVRKNYAHADWVGYLPHDTPAQARAFLDLFRPDEVWFVKYEFWFNMLYAIQERGIPLYLISGLFRRQQVFFRSYGAWFCKCLQGFRMIFVQDEKSRGLLERYDIKQVKVCGDTRLDRVIEIRDQVRENEKIRQFKRDKPLVILGSMWPADEKVLSGLLDIRNEVRILVAPHNLDEAFIEKLCHNMGFKGVRYTRASSAELSTAELLVLDTMGQLAAAYYYGDIVYVGGGFGKAVHNTMEPAVFGNPVLFGPAHTKFYEAVNLRQCKGAAAFATQAEVAECIRVLLQHTAERRYMGKQAREYVETHAGATRFIWENTR